MSSFYSKHLLGIEQCRIKNVVFFSKYCNEYNFQSYGNFSWVSHIKGKPEILYFYFWPELMETV